MNATHVIRPGSYLVFIPLPVCSKLCTNHAAKNRQVDRFQSKVTRLVQLIRYTV